MKLIKQNSLWYFSLLVYWFTGAGKTTIAYELHSLFLANNILSYILDGDVLRDGLNSDLIFDNKNRIENLRRIKHVAEVFSDGGLYHLLYLSRLSRMIRTKHELFWKITTLRFMWAPHRSYEKGIPKVYKKSKKRLNVRF